MPEGARFPADRLGPVDPRPGVHGFVRAPERERERQPAGREGWASEINASSRPAPRIAANQPCRSRVGATETTMSITFFALIFPHARPR